MIRVLLLLLACLHLNSHATPLDPVDLTLGNKFTYKAKDSEVTRDYFVRLPEGYQDNKTRHYPVIYLLDADLFYMDKLFFHSVALIERLSKTAGQGDIPPAIIVGIPFQDMDNWYKQVIVKSDEFASFLTDNLKPLIQSKYRTLDNNVLVAQSYSATFAIELLTKQPNAFDTFIAIDPIIPNQQKRQVIVEGIKQMPKTNAVLFNGQSGEPSSDILLLETTMKAHNPDAVNMQKVLYEHEGHTSVYYPALNSGLRLHFADFREPSKSLLSRKDFDFKTIDAYVSKRDNKYQITTTAEQTRAIADSVAYYYMKQRRFKLAFALYDLNENARRVKYILNRFGQQFYNAKEYQQALTVWQYMAKRFPDNEKAKQGIALAKKQML